MTKNRLKSSLNAAIGDLSTREPGSSDAYPRRISNGKQTKFHAIHQQKSVQILAQILWTLLHVKPQLTGLKKTDSSLPPLNRMRTQHELFVFISPTLFNIK
jgi:hypothetical protein